MNSENVPVKSICIRKRFVTRLTFEIFVAFMNCVNMPIQISSARKWFTTIFTFVILAAFMNLWICRFKSCAIEFSFVWQHQQNNGSQILQSYSLPCFLVDFLRLDINWKFFFAKFQLVVHKIGRACQTKQFGRAPGGAIGSYVCAEK